MSYSEFHDGRITAIGLVNEEDFKIDVHLESGEYRTLVLSGVERLKCSNFREGNIILDISIVNKRALASSMLMDIMDLKKGQMPEFIADKLTQLESGDLILVHVTPSYGCEIVALCKSLGVR